MSLNKALKRGAKKSKGRKGPLWEGPESDGPQGGITQSLLSQFLGCRERFRLLVVEGLRPADHFNHRTEYGNMWHECERALAEGDPDNCWTDALNHYCRGLSSKYRESQQQIFHWYEVCSVQFPIYLAYWKKFREPKRKSLLSEQTFKVPYELPSGRIVYLRGKWDGVSLVGTKKEGGIYLDEHKTKGEIDEQQMQRQLTFDLQTMFYVVALDRCQQMPQVQEFCVKEFTGQPIRGVQYNAVRRPLSGGKGSIRRHKATGSKPEETVEHFYSRVRDVIQEDPGYFFMRWTVDLTTQDVDRFRRECLDPILEELCHWWSYIQEGLNDQWEDAFCNGHTGHHYRFPFGVYNPLTEGRASELDGYLQDGTDVGLERSKTLFRELEE